MVRAEQDTAGTAEWEILREKRLLRKSDAGLLEILDRLEKAHPQDYSVLMISMKSCRTFVEVTERFAEAFSFPEWFGKNADALFDMLTDLRSGRYIVKVTGCRNLDRAVLLKLEMVLKAKREGGVGYGDGEAVFVIN